MHDSSYGDKNHNIYRIKIIKVKENNKGVRLPRFPFKTFVVLTLQNSSSGYPDFQSATFSSLTDSPQPQLPPDTHTPPTQYLDQDVWRFSLL